MFKPRQQVIPWTLSRYALLSNSRNTGVTRRRSRAQLATLERAQRLRLPTGVRAAIIDGRVARWICTGHFRRCFRRCERHFCADDASRNGARREIFPKLDFITRDMRRDWVSRCSRQINATRINPQVDIPGNYHGRLIRVQN